MAEGNDHVAALRGMAPVETDGLPKSTRTEGWARRTLLTQLGSWSELRHDTILYAKQSYSTYVVCEFPDAYVDPYPVAVAPGSVYVAPAPVVAAPPIVRPHTTVVVSRRAYVPAPAFGAPVPYDYAPYGNIVVSDW